MRPSTQTLPPQSETVPAAAEGEPTLADSIALYGQLAADRTYVPTVEEFWDTQSLADRLRQSVRLNEDGIASWPYVGTQGEVVDDEAASRVMGLADTKRWLLGKDDEHHLLHVARAITENTAEDPATQTASMRWLLRTLEGVGLDADRIGLDDLNREC